MSIPSSSANNPAAVITVNPSSSANNPTAVNPSNSSANAAVEIQKINALYRNMNDTILHDAAADGETLLAMEIATLKRSFAWELNGQGLSPMHLALVNGHFDTVRSLLTIDPNLVRVKGKYRMTPLHYAAEMNETEILAEFLLYCPSAIGDLNSRCESALHIAVKNRRLEAFKVMLGLLKKLRRSDIHKVLNLKDADGNNVLHIAASTNQLEVMKLLVPHIDVCTRNLQGKSCVDLADQHDEEVMKILLRRRKPLHEIKDLKELSHAEYLISCSTEVQLPVDIWRQIFSLKALPIETRNIYLVVTGLIITVTYEAMLSPPGGYNRLDTTTAAAPAPAPSPMHHNSAVEFAETTSYFLGLNSVAFFLSSFFMIALVMPLPGSPILITPAVILMSSYLLEVSLYRPMTGSAGWALMLLGVMLSFMFISDLLAILPLPCHEYLRAWLSTMWKPRLGPILPTGYIRK